MQSIRRPETWKWVEQNPWASNLLEAVRNWRESGTAPEALVGRHVVDGKPEWEMPLFPYPARAAWDAGSASYKKAEGPRGGVERVAERFRPVAAE